MRRCHIFKYLSIHLLLALALFSCSSRNTPAPVSNLTGSAVILDRNRDVINISQYTVKQGDTLYSIAWRAQSDIRHIGRLNNIASPYVIYPGQKLFLAEQKSRKH